MKDRYSVDVAWSDEDGGYIAVVPELEGLSAFGSTREEAVAEVRTAIELYVEACESMEAQLPPPRKRARYSGQLRLRMPVSLHGRLALMADSEATSLNQLIVSLLSEACGRRTASASAHPAAPPVNWAQTTGPETAGADRSVTRLIAGGAV